MGLDRFANFITKSINNDGIEDIFLKNNIRKIVASHVVFDLNFLIYQEIINIENEVNDIIKIILCLPFAINKHDILEQVLKIIFTQEHWKQYCLNKEIETLFDGYNEDIIIEKFINYIMYKANDNSNSILELVIYEKIVNTIIENINNIHIMSFIQELLIFYDGMPSISKVIEQRRRRIKNHLESNQKKVLFKMYFDNLLPNNKKLFENMSKKWFDNDDNENILFDYFKWINNRFSVDKSIGPSSYFIKNLEHFMNIRLKKLLPKISIYISSANMNGESDLKIFKYISQFYAHGDFCIHTTDSDLIHMILTQQTYYKIIDKDINLSVIKYLKNYNSDEYAQILEAPIIIKNILELYNNINNIKTNNYKIIWDICLLFLFFGNDHLPSSVEIGPELGLEFFLKKHYSAIGKNNIINLDKHIHSLDLNNLLLVLEKINETKNNNSTKIILQRFFKMNITLINILTDKFNFCFEEILDFLKTFIIFRTLQLSPEEYNKLLQNSNESDLRIVLLNSLSNDMIKKYKTIDCFNFNENKKKLLNENIKIIENNIDYHSHDYMGLVTYNKPHVITSDPYQDIYNYILDKSTNTLSNMYPLLYDHIDISVHLNIINNTNNNPNDYIKKIYHLILTQFGYMKDFHTDNLTFYKYNYVPSLDSIILYLKSMKNTDMTKKWLNEIILDNVDPNNYLTPFSHHLLITPFITNIPEHVKNIPNFKDLNNIKNLWFNENICEYRDIDIRMYLETWKKLNNTPTLLSFISINV